MEFSDFDTASCVESMSYDNLASIPLFLRKEDRLALLRELETYERLPARTVSGPYKVRQEYVQVREFREDSLFLSLQESLTRFLGARLDSRLSSPLRFNDVVAQTYAPGSIGITPHKDGESFRNVVALRVLEGVGEFGTCEDREGRGFRPVRNDPGTLLLMRAPGFLNTAIQPFHTLRNITSTRTTVGLRQKVGR
jgi:hypothetical protein